jgi:hypothetical protein
MGQPETAHSKLVHCCNCNRFGLSHHPLSPIQVTEHLSFRMLKPPCSESGINENKGIKLSSVFQPQLFPPLPLTFGGGGSYKRKYWYNIPEKSMQHPDFSLSTIIFLTVSLSVFFLLGFPQQLPNILPPVVDIGIKKSNTLYKMGPQRSILVRCISSENTLKNIIKSTFIWLSDCRLGLVL